MWKISKVAKSPEFFEYISIPHWLENLFQWGWRFFSALGHPIPFQGSQLLPLSNGLLGLGAKTSLLAKRSACISRVRVVTCYTQNRWDSDAFSYTFHLGEMFYFDITHSAEWKQKFSSNNLWWSFISPNNDQPVYACISNTGNPWRAPCVRSSNWLQPETRWSMVDMWGICWKCPKQSSARAGIESSTA